MLAVLRHGSEILPLHYNISVVPITRCAVRPVYFSRNCAGSFVDKGGGEIVKESKSLPGFSKFCFCYGEDT